MESLRLKNRKAQQKYLSNEANVYKKNKERTLKRLTTGKVSLKTLERYDITPEEANRIRKDANLEPIDYRQPETIRINTLLAKKEQEESETKAINTQIELAQKVRVKASKKLKNVTKKLEETPNENIESTNKKISFHDIRDYWFERSKYNSNAYSITTAENYFGKTHESGGSFRKLLKFVKCDPFDNIAPCFKNVTTWISAIKKDVKKNKLSQNTYKSYIQVLLVIMDQYLLLLKFYPELKTQRDILKNEFDGSKKSASIFQLTTQNIDKVPPFSEIKSKILNKYDDKTQEFLYISLYECVPVRDDYGDLLITDSLKKSSDKDQNFVVITKQYVYIVLNVYKTDEKYGRIQHKLEKHCAKYIRDSLKLKPRTHLFIKNTVYNKIKSTDKASNITRDDLYGGNNALSNFVGNMLKKSQVKTQKTNLSGNINLLRHAIISEYLNSGIVRTAKERELFAAKLLHSPITSQQYVRDLHIDKINLEEIEKRELNLN